MPPDVVELILDNLRDLKADLKSHNRDQIEEFKEIRAKINCLESKISNLKTQDIAGLKAARSGSEGKLIVLVAVVASVSGSVAGAVVSKIGSLVF